MALSDFTDATKLGVTIVGVPFPHRLFHFVMATAVGSMPPW